MKTTTQKFINSFCSGIDQLTEAWNTATDYNYDNVHPEEPGCKVIFFAIKLGLTTLDGEMPYKHNEWWVNSVPKDAKERYPNAPKDLQKWKKKAEALGPETKLFTLPQETNITKAKIEKFLRIADEAIDIQKYNPGSFIPGPNQEIVTRGLLLNDIALELGLIDPDWRLAEKCGLGYTLDFKMIGLQETQEPNLELYKELQIDANCCKFPFVVREAIWGGGHIDENRLQPLVVKAETLLEIPTEPQESIAFKPSPDFRNITATVRFTLTEDQAECIRILSEARDKGIDELNGETILIEAGIVDKNFSKKMKDVFKNNPAWNTLIIQGSKRGNYRLGI